jgi:hypothetical protein
MGHGPRRLGVSQAAVNGLQDIDVVEHVVKRAIVRRSVQEIADSVLGRHLASVERCLQICSV